MTRGEEDIGGGGEAGLIKFLDHLQVIPDPDSVGEAVRELAESTRGDEHERAGRAVSKAIWLMTGAGVVASLPGAIPGLGTTAQAGILAGSITGETWVLLRNLTVMQLVVAGIYGHKLEHSRDPSKVHPERLNELLIIWGLETGVVVPATEAGKRVGTKVAVSQFNKKVSGEVLAKINRKLGTTVVTKYGTKRGGIALGRLIPFGVGATIGGGMNYLAASSFGRAVIKYYSELRPHDGADPEVLLVD